jgi:aspartate racemase
VGVKAGATKPAAMKTIGILGGMSNAATVEYYRLINAAVNARLGGWDIAETIIVGVNFGEIERFIRNDSWDAAEAYLSDKADRLIRAGADLIICMSNTMHRVVAPIMAKRDVPFIHIVDPTARAINRAGLRRVALFGTKPTMAADFLPARYRDKFGVEIVAPSEDEQIEIDRIIFDELVRGKILAPSKARYLAIADRMRADGAQALILGCTEIFLLMQQDDRPHFPMFDTTALHVAAAVEAALG